MEARLLHKDNCLATWLSSLKSPTTVFITLLQNFNIRRRRRLYCFSLKKNEGQLYRIRFVSKHILIRCVKILCLNFYLKKDLSLSAYYKHESMFIKIKLKN